jgi:uncharacterized protein (TIGR03545 family)
MILRKSALITLTITAIAVAAASWFIDGKIAGSIAATALEGVVGARVEIAELHFTPRQGTIKLSQVEVADPADPWRNLIAFNHATLAIDPLQLFAGKLIIRHMTLQGATSGGKRRSSGALPATARPAVATDTGSRDGGMMAELWQQGIATLRNQIPHDAGLVGAANNHDSGQILQQINLATEAHLLQMEADAAAAEAWWESRSNEAGYQPEIDEIQQRLAELKQRDWRDLSTLQQNQEEIKAIRAALDQLQQQARNDRQQLRHHSEVLRQGIAGLDNHYKSDLAATRAYIANLRQDKREWARLLLGDAVVGQLDEALGYLQLARQYLPRGEDQPATKPAQGLRTTGRIVTYTTFGTPLPRLLLQQAHFDGQSEGADGVRHTFQGELRALAANPRHYPHPVTLALQLQRPNQPDWAISGEFDRRQSISRDHLTFAAAGIDLGRIPLSCGSALPQAIESDAANSHLKMSLVDNALAAELELTTPRMRFIPHAADDGQQRRWQQALFADLTAVTLGATMGGSLQHPRLSITSNIDEMMSERANLLWQSERQALETATTAALEARVAALRQRAGDRADQLEARINQRLGDQQAKLDALRNESAAWQQQLQQQQAAMQQRLKSERERANAALQEEEQRVRAEAAAKEASARARLAEQEAAAAARLQQEQQRLTAEAEAKRLAEEERAKQKAEDELRSRLRNLIPRP